VRRKADLYGWQELGYSLAGVSCSYGSIVSVLVHKYRYYVSGFQRWGTMQDCMLPWVAAASTNRGQHIPSSHRNMQCWRAAKSVSSFASDAPAMPSADPSQTPARRTRAQAPTASILQLSPRMRFQAASERQRRGIPQPSPTGWVAGPPMHEPCKGGITARINPKHIVRHTSPDTVRGRCGIRLETTTVGDVPPGCRYSAPPHLHRIG
jgi:hypothetical protein